MQLHDGLAVVPLVKEFQQIDGALALVGDAQVAGLDGGAGADGHAADALILRPLGPGEGRQEDVVLGVVPHKLLDVPPHGHPHIALLALGDELAVALGEHLHVHQALRVPVVEVGQAVPVGVAGADKFHLAVASQMDVVDHVVGPVGEAEAGVEDILTPAPLVKAGGHRNGGAGGVAVIFGGHVVVLECLEHVVELVQRGGHLQPQVVQPGLVNHAVLGDGEDGERLVHRGADAGGGHLLPRGQAVDFAVLLGDGRPDLRVLLQDGAQVGHDVRGEVGGHVQKGAVVPVPGQVIVGEAHPHKGVGVLAAGDADVHLLGQGVGHGLPVDFDAGAGLEGVQHLVAVIASGQGGHAAHDIELGLFRVGVDGAVVHIDHQSTGAAGQKAQGQGSGEERGKKLFLHGISSSLSP